MKIPSLFLAALGLWTIFTGTAHARNVQLILPIAAALEAADIPDRRRAR